jgi:hypothetical protein
LLLTLLDSPDKWSDAMVLFNWGFAQTPSTTDMPTANDADETGSSVSTLPPAPAGRADGQ